MESNISDLINISFKSHAFLRTEGKLPACKKSLEFYFLNITKEEVLDQIGSLRRQSHWSRYKKLLHTKASEASFEIN